MVYSKIDSYATIMSSKLSGFWGFLESIDILMKIVVGLKNESAYYVINSDDE